MFHFQQHIISMTHTLKMKFTNFPLNTDGVQFFKFMIHDWCVFVHACVFVFYSECYLIKPRALNTLGSSLPLSCTLRPHVDILLPFFLLSE